MTLRGARFARRLNSLLCLASIPLAASVAGADPIGGPPPFMATVRVSVDGSPEKPVPVMMNGAGTGWVVNVQAVVDGIGNSDPAYLDYSIDSGNGDILIAFGSDEVSFSPSQTFGVFDPVLNLAAGVTDAGAPSGFSFSVVSPLVPTLFGDVAYDIDFAGIFTDGGTNGGSITAGGTFGTMDVSLDGSDIDGVGGDDTFTAALEVYGPFAKSGNFDCGGTGCSSFDISFTFTGSGDNDTYALNGRFFVVPEPGTAGLVGLGLIGLALARGRRR